MTTQDGRLSGEALVAHNLRRLRKAFRLSQDDIAERMRRLGFKFHQTQVAKIERGDRPLRYDEVLALAEVLSVPALPFMTEPVAGEGEAEFELLEAKFRVQAAQQEHETARDLADKAQEHYEEVLREYREIAERLGAEDEFQPVLRFYPAPNTPGDPLREPDPDTDQGA
ncbi:helix-turn-helix transcriptional regulator [Streptomyces sp. T-3]|nr:helix-turn-helix transcriptional regulator [Streptomyces sp. T-3]